MEDLLKQLALEKQLQDDKAMDTFETIEGNMDDMGLIDEAPENYVEQDQAQDIYNAEVNSEAQSEYMKTKDEQMDEAMPEVAARHMATVGDEDQDAKEVVIEKERTAQEKMVDELRKLREDQSREVQTAREEDASNRKMAAIIQGLNQMAVGSAAQQSGVYSKPMDIAIPQSNSGNQVQGDYQDKMKSLMDEYKILKTGELTPYQVASLKNQESQLENTELNRELRKANKDLTETRLNTKEDQRQNEYVSNKIIDLRKSLSGDARFKQMTKEGMAFDQVDNLMELAEKGNQVAFGALGTKMARAMGEVGVLTDADVVRYVRGGSLSRSAADALSKWMTGKPSKASLEDIKDISRVLKDIHATKLEPIFDEYAKTAYENLPISRRESYERLSIPIPAKLKKAQAFFQKNKKMLAEQGINTESEAEQYLMKLGKL